MKKTMEKAVLHLVMAQIGHQGQHLPDITMPGLEGEGLVGGFLGYNCTKLLINSSIKSKNGLGWKGL